MSFDVIMIHFREGDSAETDRVPVRDILLRARHKQIGDEPGSYNITFDDGSDVEFVADVLTDNKPFSACNFYLRGFSESIMQFMLDVARAGNMAMLPTMDGPVVILTSESLKNELPKDMIEEFKVVVISSAKELAMLLMGGFEDWRAYRDHVFKQSKSDDGR